jgi:two-component system, NarL family, invasion response regulator UvrY
MHKRDTTEGARTQPLRLLLVDDHAVVRRGLRDILDAAFPGLQCEEAGRASETMSLVTSREWDLVILDVTLPDRSGLDVLKDLKAVKPRLPVLVLSIHPAEQFAVRVLKAGAAGYLTKDSAPDELVAAVRAAVAGGRNITPAVAVRLAASLGRSADTQPHELLSDREFQVLRLIGAGRTASEIARDLSLSVKTVSTYRRRLLEKMGLRTNAELTAYGARQGLV